MALEVTEARINAFVWKPLTPNGSVGNVQDLNDLIDPTERVHWKLLSAVSINDFGQIIGAGLYDPDGPGGLPAVQRSFLATPVPEPQTIVLAGFIAFGASCRLRLNIRRADRV